MSLSKNYFYKLFLLSIFAFFSYGFSITTTNVFQNIETNVRITKRIPIPFIVDSLTVELNIPSDFTNGVNLQKITSFNIGSVTGGFYSRQLFIDKFGNNKIRIIFKNPFGEVFIDYGFTFSSMVKPIPNSISSSYPIDPKRLIGFNIYLAPTLKVQPGNHETFALVEELKKGTEYIDRIVINILNWVQKNIIHEPNVGYDDALTTFLNKRGNENGIKNLSLMLLRAAKIPSRIVKGISIDKTYNISFNSSFIELSYPKGYYSWLEVYLPTRSWVPFDIFSTMFFIPDNLIRLTTGSDTEDIIDKQHFSNGFVPKSYDNFFFENVSSNDNITIQKYATLENRILLFPPGNDAEHFVMINSKDNQKQTAYNGIFLPHQEDHKSYPLLRFDVSDRIKTNYSSIINLKVNDSSLYAQSFYLDRNIFLDHISIPLFVSGIYPSNAKIEIYSDENDKPKTVYTRSYSNVIKSSLDKSSNYKFYFNRNQWPLLQKGKYWIILRADEKEQIFWQAIFGNLYGNKSDTRKNRGHNWSTICHVDFLFELWGNYISGQKNN